MSTQLPPWVYDMVMDLQYWEDTHPTLYAQSSVSDDFQRVECGCRALNRVPADVLAQASVIKGYMASREATE